MEFGRRVEKEHTLGDIPRLQRELGEVREEVEQALSAQEAVEAQMRAVYDQYVGQKLVAEGFARALYDSTTGETHDFLGPYGSEKAYVPKQITSQPLEIIRTTHEGVIVKPSDDSDILLLMEFGAIFPRPDEPPTPEF